MYIIRVSTVQTFFALIEEIRVDWQWLIIYWYQNDNSIAKNPFVTWEVRTIMMTNLSFPNFIQDGEQKTVLLPGILNVGIHI